MMIFESNREYQELVGEVTLALDTLGKKDKNPNPKKQGIGGVVPDEELRVPSDGHADSTRDTKVSSKNQPKYDDGPFIEDLEDKLYKILLEAGAGLGGSGSGSRPIPTTDVLGTSSGKEGAESLSTPNKAARQAAKSREGGAIEQAAEEELSIPLTPEAQEMKDKGKEQAQRNNEAEQTTPPTGIESII